MSDDRFEPENNHRPRNPKPWRARNWESHQAPGTPASLEALFLLIKTARTESKEFQWGRRFWHQLTDDEIWECYDAWTAGRVHPVLLEKGRKFDGNSK